jgi:hypothetical protein
VPPISKDDCPPSHPIKGNQGSRSTTDWIYHPPGSRSYAATDPEECFATAADAEATVTALRGTSTRSRQQRF